MAQEPKKRMGRPPKPEGEKVKLGKALIVKCKPDWREWLEGLANHLGQSSSEAVGEGLKLLAKEKNYPPPPDRA